MLVITTVCYNMSMTICICKSWSYQEYIMERVSVYLHIDQVCQMIVWNSMASGKAVNEVCGLMNRISHTNTVKLTLSFKKICKADQRFDDSRVQNQVTSISVGLNILFIGVIMPLTDHCMMLSSDSVSEQLLAIVNIYSQPKYLNILLQNYQ